MSRVLSLSALLVFLAPYAPAETPAQSLRDYVVQGANRTAYGIYVGNKKAGWEVDEIKLGKHDDKEVAVETSQSYMAVMVDGTKTIVEQKEIDCYGLEGEGNIVFSELRVIEDGQETVRTAVRKGDGMVQTTKVGDRKTERKLPLPKGTLALERRLEAWLRTAKKGDVFDNWTTSWDEDVFDVKETYTFKEKKPIALGGVETEAFVVQTLSQGARSNEELLSDARPLTVKVGVMDMRMEKEAVAKKLDENVDLMAATSIKVDKSLGRASRIDRLTLELTGLDDFALPEAPRQRIVSRKGDVAVLELSRDRPTDKPAALTEDQRKEYLKATTSMQSDSETIRKLAQKIVGDEKDPLKAATLLEKWVYKHLRKTYDANADDALTVLANRAGDCTEHTLLFTTLARAAGIPARQVGGVVYVGGDAKAFAWHAWSEIHDGKQWVTIDPTFNQVYIDPTHIKFSEGSEDQAYLNVAGKLKMKVLKVENRK